MLRVLGMALPPIVKAIDLGVFVAAFVNIVDWHTAGAEGVLLTTYISIEKLMLLIGGTGADPPRKKRKRNRRKRKKKR